MAEDKADQIEKVSHGNADEEGGTSGTQPSQHSETSSVKSTEPLQPKIPTTRHVCRAVRACRHYCHDLNVKLLAWLCDRHRTQYSSEFTPLDWRSQLAALILLGVSLFLGYVALYLSYPVSLEMTNITIVTLPLMPQWTAAEDMGVFFEVVVLLTIAILVTFMCEKFLEFKRAWRVAATILAFNVLLVFIVLVMYASHHASALATQSGKLWLTTLFSTMAAFVFFVLPTVLWKLELCNLRPW